MSDKVILVGAGGHAKVIADIVLRSGDQLLGFLDDDPSKTFVLGYPVLGYIKKWRELSEVAKFLVAVGDNYLRESLVEKMQVNWYTAIHPSAQIGMDVVIGEGSAVMANAVINPEARIGKHCIVNTAAVVEHGDQIGDYVHVSVGTKLGGAVEVGKSSWIGIGATVKNNVSICEDCIIGAGGVVVKNIVNSGIYCGIPAKIVIDTTKMGGGNSIPQ